MLRPPGPGARESAEIAVSPAVLHLEVHLQPPAATPSVFAASASWLPAGTQWLELGGGGRGCIPSRPLPPRQSRERSEKYPKVLRRARAKRKKRAQPPTSLGVVCPDLATRAAPPAAAHTPSAPSPGSLAVGCALPLQPSPDRRGTRRVLARLPGTPCPTTTHSASPLHLRRPRTPLGHPRRARPAALAKLLGRCLGAPVARAPGPAAAAARGRQARAPGARSPRGCPSARDAGTTATRRRSRATSASACGGTASARSAT